MSDRKTTEKQNCYFVAKLVCARPAVTDMSANVSLIILFGTMFNNFLFVGSDTLCQNGHSVKTQVILLHTRSQSTAPDWPVSLS